MQEMFAVLFDLIEGGIIPAVIVAVILSFIDNLSSSHRISGFFGTAGIWLLCSTMSITFFNSSFYVLPNIYFVMIFLFIYFLVSLIMCAIIWRRPLFPIKRIVYMDYFESYKWKFKYTKSLIIPGALLILISIVGYFNLTDYWNSNDLTTTISVIVVGLLFVILGVRGNIKTAEEDKREAEERNERKKHETEIEKQKELKEKRRRAKELEVWNNSPEKREIDRKEKANKEFWDKYNRENPINIPPVSIDMNKVMGDMQKKIKNGDY